jgi:hypothetical protein
MYGMVSSSSVAADAAIRKIKGRPSLGDQISLNYRFDRIIKVLVLSFVGTAIIVAVLKTLPVEEHAVSGMAKLGARSLGRVTIKFEMIGGSGCSRVILTGTDGKFSLKGLHSGIYAISVRPGESGLILPKEYLSTETSPLRFEIREDLSGMQVYLR